MSAKVHQSNMLTCVITQVTGDKVCNSQQENDEQIKSNLRTSIYCKICLVIYMAQDELRNKSTGIIHNELIMQQEDY